jgi:RimJ/RimL family protein N-acetyltransferase
MRKTYLRPIRLTKNNVFGRIWTYFPYGPFKNFDSYLYWMKTTCLESDPLFFAVIDPESDKAIGVSSYLRIDPDNGSIEVGHINFSPILQRTPAATEAMYLMMKNAFELGYRRYEWKCDALNTRSRRAAERIGLSFEGIFRQATTYKGRNRDTAWYATVDFEWPVLKKVFLRWLDSGNFDEAGNQISQLSHLTQPINGPRG